eukprot:m.174015 g.174015  ORF g.174015 m.174015 type:complete len:176 (-) comp31748_c5_seq1:44-571(-)
MDLLATAAQSSPNVGQYATRSRKQGFPMRGPPTEEAQPLAPPPPSTAFPIRGKGKAGKKAQPATKKKKDSFPMRGAQTTGFEGIAKLSQASKILESNGGQKRKSKNNASSQEDEQKLSVKRAKNREAAQKCRKKRNDTIASLSEQVAEQEQKNVALRSKMSHMQSELKRLMAMNS